MRPVLCYLFILLLNWLALDVDSGAPSIVACRISNNLSLPVSRVAERLETHLTKKARVSSPVLHNRMCAPYLRCG